LLLNSNGAIEDTIVTDLPGIIDYPSFTPDGNGIIYTRDISGFESDLERQLNTHIFRVNLDGTELTDLSLEKPQGTNDLYPSFSGSGGEIIFANAPSNKMEESKIYTMTPEGMKRTFLFPEGKYPERR
jgi:TolB protein